MAKRRNISGSPFDGERPFTTAWGEYDSRQSSAWSDDGYTPDWAHPYDFDEKDSSRNTYTSQTRTAPNPSVASVWKNWHGVKSPSRVLAIVLAVVFGSLGVHRFYVGDKETGVIMLGITLLSAGRLSWASTLWGFVDAYNYFKMSDTEFKHYCIEKR